MNDNGRPNGVVLSQSTSCKSLQQQTLVLVPGMPMAVVLQAAVSLMYTVTSEYSIHVSLGVKPALSAARALLVCQQAQRARHYPLPVL